MKPLVSVVIPTYNRSEMLCQCIRSVLASDWGNLEVIIADDCSPDDTAQRVRELARGDMRVKYARTPENGFTSAARNCGAKVAKGKYLFFIDDDNELEPMAISEMMACFARHPKATFVAPMTMHRRKDGQLIVWSLGCTFDPWTTIIHEYLKNTPLDKIPARIDYPTTCAPNAFAVTRDAFDKVDGFDAGYGMQFDETDFGLRTTKGLGTEGYFCAKARTLHLGYLDSAEVGLLRALGMGNPRRAYCFGRNRVKFARRHFSFVQALICAFVAAPASAVHYGFMALKCKHPDIAFAYFKGTLAGMFGIYLSKFYSAFDNSSCSMPFHS